jgi:hypothetical protein
LSVFVVFLFIDANISGNKSRKIRDTGKIVHTRHRTKIKKNKKIQKTKTITKTDTTPPPTQIKKNTEVNTGA